MQSDRMEEEYTKTGDLELEFKSTSTPQEAPKQETPQEAPKQETPQEAPQEASDPSQPSIPNLSITKDEARDRVW